MGFADAFQRLRAVALHRVEPSPLPSALALLEIQINSEVFQPRKTLMGRVDESHVIDLMAALENEPSGLLDPLTVWWSGSEWLLVDGHHRFEAYQRHYVKSNKLGSLKVPVSVVVGGLLDALSSSISENAKVRLELNDSDRFDTAWRLVCAGEKNRDKIAPRCGIGSSTVQSMMTRLRVLKEEDPLIDVDDLSEQGWVNARDLGKAERKVDAEWVDRLAASWAQRLAKEFGTKLRKNPDAFFKALCLYSTPMTPSLYDRMGDHFGRDEEGEDGDY